MEEEDGRRFGRRMINLVDRTDGEDGEGEGRRRKGNKADKVGR